MPRKDLIALKNRCLIKTIQIQAQGTSYTFFLGETDLMKKFVGSKSRIQNQYSSVLPKYPPWTIDDAQYGRIKQIFKIEKNSESSKEKGMSSFYKFIKKFPYYFDEDFEEMCRRLEEVLFQERTLKNDLSISFTRHSVLPHQEPYKIAKEFSKELDDWVSMIPLNDEDKNKN